MTTSAHGPHSRRHRREWPQEPLAATEQAWLHFIRLIWGGHVPSPTLRLVQAVTLACRNPELVLKSPTEQVVQSGTTASTMSAMAGS